MNDLIVTIPGWVTPFAIVSGFLITLALASFGALVVYYVLTHKEDLNG